MKNYVQAGNTLTLIALAAVASGGGHLVGTIFGVAVKDVAQGAEGEFKRDGVFELPKVSAQAWTQGAKVYWDDTAKLVTTVATNNVVIGAAALAAANPSAIGTVLLDAAIR
ncbi:DUF2190 family protein [Variovorax ginsengisoli]|uniref:RecA/RadA family phage recombinase n=1 Tax=Variovorax ginsengisoli TaxID=363844 RepID=A0ABT9SGU6_9BURK|nr:DUF2190 family protein [Variovorax ginsengisoli]MDP9902617.1 putative RecA/RadA family phage recombinase [Variovorax ginsengisoli]